MPQFKQIFFSDADKYASIEDNRARPLSGVHVIYYGLSNIDGLPYKTSEYTTGVSGTAPVPIGAIFYVASKPGYDVMNGYERFSLVRKSDEGDTVYNYAYKQTKKPSVILFALLLLAILYLMYKYKM